VVFGLRLLGKVESWARRGYKKGHFRGGEGRSGGPQKGVAWAELVGGNCGGSPWMRGFMRGLPKQKNTQQPPTRRHDGGTLGGKSLTSRGEGPSKDFLLRVRRWGRNQGIVEKKLVKGTGNG